MGTLGDLLRLTAINTGLHGVHGDIAAGFEKEVHKSSFFFVFIDCIGLNPSNVISSPCGVSP